MSENATVTTTDSGCGEAGAGLLATDPFRSLNVHFGMLLGVDDFATMSAYHRGKTWLHSAWLHGPGVVWGLGVELDADDGEIRVAPGLAIDGRGRELYLETAACVHVATWFAEHRDDDGFEIEERPDGSLRFTAHVVIRHRPCLARPVPALVEPCDGSGETTACSRVEETVELLLVPGPAPERRKPPGTLPYHRLRLLFALEEAIEDDGDVIPGDQEVLDARKEILDLALEDQPAAYLDAFRRFAALDAIDLEPASSDDERSLYPHAEPAELVLAEATGLVLTPEDGGHALSVEEGGGIDHSVRFTHVATATIQELLNGPRWSAPAPAPGNGDAGIRESGGDGDRPGNGDRPGDGDGRTGPGDGREDAGGPRAIEGSVGVTQRQIGFTVDRELLPASVRVAAFEVTTFDAENGWVEVPLRRAALSKNRLRVTAVFRETLEDADLIRLIARGTGPAPILGEDAVPFAGGPDSPPASVDDGNDFVVMYKRS